MATTYTLLSYEEDTDASIAIENDQIIGYIWQASHPTFLPKESALPEDKSVINRFCASFQNATRDLMVVKAPPDEAERIFDDWNDAFGEYESFLITFNQRQFRIFAPADGN